MRNIYRQSRFGKIVGKSTSFDQESINASKDHADVCFFDQAINDSLSRLQQAELHGDFKSDLNSTQLMEDLKKIQESLKTFKDKGFHNQAEIQNWLQKNDTLIVSIQQDIDNIYDHSIPESNTNKILWKIADALAIAVLAMLVVLAVKLMLFLVVYAAGHALTPPQGFIGSLVNYVSTSAPVVLAKQTGLFAFATGALYTFFSSNEKTKIKKHIKDAIVESSGYDQFAASYQLHNRSAVTGV